MSFDLSALFLRLVHVVLIIILFYHIFSEFVFEFIKIDLLTWLSVYPGAYLILSPDPLHKFPRNSFISNKILLDQEVRCAPLMSAPFM